jgi:signal transduction histidine kinase
VRRRLLSTTLAVLTAALLAFAVPLALAVQGQLEAQALDVLAGRLSQLATVIEEQARTCSEVGLYSTLAARDGFDVALFDRQGGLRFAAGDARPAGATPDVTAAATGAVGRARLDGRLAVAVPLSSEVCGDRLVLHTSTSDADLVVAIRRARLGIAAVGVAVLGLAAAAATLLGARLARPLEALAGTARRLGEGDFSTRAPRSGLPEPDEIADALDATADRLGRAVARGTAFTADASHQLRTPLTALRLHLEGLDGPDAPPAVADALHEADRLDATIRELVALTRLDAPTEPVDLAELLEHRVDDWQRRARIAGRDLELALAPTPALAVRRAAVAQAVEVLVDNAIAHGRGAITVRLAPSASDGAGPRGARICVGDEGDGPRDGTVGGPPSTDRGVRLDDLPLEGGRGLPLARSLIAGEGGRITSERGDGFRVCLVLPGRRAGVTD